MGASLLILFHTHPTYLSTLHSSHFCYSYIVKLEYSVLFVCSIVPHDNTQRVTTDVAFATRKLFHHHQDILPNGGMLESDRRVTSESFCIFLENNIQQDTLFTDQVQQLVDFQIAFSINSVDYSDRVVESWKGSLRNTVEIGGQDTYLTS